MLERVRLESCLSLLICDNPSHASSWLCAPSRTRAIFSGDTPAKRARTAVIQVATASGVSRESGFSLLYAVPAVSAAQTEFRYHYGKLANPLARTRHFTDILAVQQASSWSPGDSIVLIDILEDGVADGFNDLEFYGEWYPTLSFGRLADRTVGGGRVRDVALIGGINFDGDANVVK